MLPAPGTLGEPQEEGTFDALLREQVLGLPFPEDPNWEPIRVLSGKAPGCEKRRRKNRFPTFPHSPPLDCEPFQADEHVVIPSSLYAQQGSLFDANIPSQGADLKGLRQGWACDCRFKARKGEPQRAGDVSRAPLLE